MPNASLDARALMLIACPARPGHLNTEKAGLDLNQNDTAKG